MIFRQIKEHFLQILCAFYTNVHYFEKDIIICIYEKKEEINALFCSNFQS